MAAILSEIVSLLVGGITGIAQGIGTGLSTLAKSIFIEEVTSGGTTTTQLSTFGALVVVFAGVSLAIGLSKLIVRWVSTLGASRV